MPKSAPRSSRSPIREAPLPLPGESSQLRLLDVVVEKCFIWTAIAGILIVQAAVEWWRWAAELPPAPAGATVLALGSSAFAFFKVRRGFREARELRLGIDGERDVARALEDLRPSGYHIFHDIENERGNVDHVAIGPTGVFVIETKTRSKPIGRDATQRRSINHGGSERKLLATRMLGLW